MRADLHVHSSASDGTDPPAEVMRRAARAGLDVVALTDHDTVAGHAEARQALADSLTLLPGMELSCRLGQHSRGVPGGLSGSSPRGQHSLHLLAYLFDPGHPDLAAELGRIRDDRVLRARAMVRRLADLGVRSEEHTSELQSRSDLVCRLLLEKKKKKQRNYTQEKKKKHKK